MQGTTFQTVTPPVFPAVNPSAIAKATKVPIRVFVRNISGTTIFFAANSQDVAGPQGPTSQTFQLPAGFDAVFILAPGQPLYAISLGAGGAISISLSEALPLATP